MSKTKLFARLIKVEHTIFALPFAYVGAFLAVDGVPSGHDLLWITVAMAGARSLAMALNRLIDAGIDAANPRTAGRELPSGALTLGAVVAFCLASLALFLLAVWQLNPVVRYLWPIPVAAFVILPLPGSGSRGSATSGSAPSIGLHAPVGGWVAITRERSPWQAWALGGAVAVVGQAGFDIFYSLFDVEVDRAQGTAPSCGRCGSGERSAFAGARPLHIWPRSRS